MSLYILLMGVQGSGKGTQAAFLQQEYGIPHVSTGDLFRAMRTRTDSLAVSIQETMAAGKLISDAQTNQVVEERLQKDDARNGVIFDGYPRTIPQAEWLDQYLASKGAKLNAVLLLQLDLYTAFKRTFGRIGDYNIYFNSDGIEWQFVNHEDKTLFPPRLEAVVTVTGEKLVRRPDDASAHAILKRIDTFIEETAVLIPYYKSRNIVYEIDANQPIETVRAEFKRIVEQVK
ncbi:MAG: nucleoside monophosphate kinase [bacterium]|nr:nucleoside monophosphate kinase [bacterium]